MKIGLGSSLLEASLGNVNADGIGTYTKALMYELGQLREPSVSVVPIAYRRLRQLRPSRSVFPNGRFFTLSYPLSSLLSETTGLGFPGERGLRSAIDVFHSTDYLIPRLSKIPVVATLCDAIQLKHPEWCGQQLSGIRRALMRSAASRAQHVIAISHAAVDDIAEWFGVRSTEITVVHLGVSEVWFRKIEEQVLRLIREKYSLPRRYVLSVGTLQPRKNVERLVTAYRSLPQHIRDEVKLVVVGKIGWNVAALVNDLQELRSSGSALWLDYVPFEDLRAIYQLAEVFAFPSLYEGFGLPVLEAFASGTAVVASNTTSIPEVAGDAALLADPLDSEAIGGALERVLEDSALATSLRSKGLTRARSFTWSRCATETLKVYRSALA